MDPIAKSYLQSKSQKKIETPKEDSPYDHMEDVNTIIASSHGDKEQKEQSVIDTLKSKIQESYTIKTEVEEPYVYNNAKWRGTSVEDETNYRAAEAQKNIEDFSGNNRFTNNDIYDFYRYTGNHKIANKFANKYINLFKPKDDQEPAIQHRYNDGESYEFTPEHMKIFSAESENINRVLERDTLDETHIEHVKNIINSHPINSPVRSKLEQKYGWFMDRHSDSVEASDNNKDLFIDKDHIKSALDKGLRPRSGRIFSDKDFNLHHLNKDGSLTRVSGGTMMRWETHPDRNTHPVVSREQSHSSIGHREILGGYMDSLVYGPKRNSKNLRNYTDDSRELNAYTALKNLGHHLHVLNNMTDEQKERILELPDKLSEEIKHPARNPAMIVHHGVTTGFDPSHDIKAHKVVPIEDQKNYVFNTATHELKTALMTHAKNYLGADKDILSVQHPTMEDRNKFEVTHADKKTGEVSRQKFQLTKKEGYTKPEKYIGHLPAFTSTSFDINIAESFAKRRRDEHLNKDVQDIISLKVPENYKHGIYVEPITNNRGEHEYLLDQNHLVEYGSEPKYYVGHNGSIFRHWEGNVIPKKDD